jgi:Zn-dependent M28 family amino/carboxypeptidase
MHDGEVFNGADDDGSGTVAILEIAEAFKAALKDGNGPKAINYLFYT